MQKRRVFDVSAAERTQIFEDYWETGGLRFRGCFEDLITSKTANNEAANFLKSKIRDVVQDPETADKLATIDHPYGAKRPPIDTNYFETFNRDNVALIDLRADPIERITAAGVKTTRTEHSLDIIRRLTGKNVACWP